MSEFSYFALRHKATGQLMPEFENGRGYSHWTPTADLQNTGNDSGMTGTVRLFATYKGADNARVAWARGIHERSYTGPTLEDLGGDDYVKARDVGRTKDDLEVVPMVLAPADKCVLHIKFSQQQCVDFMRKAFEQTLAEHQDIGKDASRLAGLYRMLEEASKQPSLTITHHQPGEWSLRLSSGTTWTASSFEKVIDNAVKYALD
jgi:hypothetical protein